MRLKIVVVVLFAVALGRPAQAQITYDKVLIPVLITGTLPGANGSQWTSELTITDRSDEGVFIAGVAEATCHLQVEPCPTYFFLDGQTTFFPTEDAPGITYFFIYVESGRRSDLAISDRFADQSRQSGTWGTSVPVVYESDALSGPITFVPVPSEEQSRATLRVYDFQPSASHGVTVKLYETSHAGDPEVFPSDVLVAQSHLNFSVIDSAFPGYIEVPLAALGVSAPSAGTDELRLDVIPDDSAKEYWGIVSVTNNDTQQATVILPQ